MSTLVTGANGFIGTALIKRLADARVPVRAAARSTDYARPDSVVPAVIGDIGPGTDWDEALAGVDRVAHLASRVHVMRDTAKDPLREFRRVNVEGTLNLARQAALAGVKRFVFISSIKVNGESTRGGERFRLEDAPRPADPYAMSKHEAEIGLRSIAAESGMELVVVRPALVYGPGVKGNFLALMRLVAKGIPLPFASVRNARSMMGLGNLVDLIARCLEHPAAADRVFLACDGADHSTAELIRALGRALGRPARLFAAPPALLRAAGRLLGRSGQVSRLLDDLRVDGSATFAVLGWRPPDGLEAELDRTARRFLESGGGGAK
ncbi:MAG: NAD-dependent epimerase/dehydratase family protein [Spirochaetales bacterium]|nr:NAD-dependent epimerase/dehydratase family protein [Spirochaetales bacterium]